MKFRHAAEARNVSPKWCLLCTVAVALMNRGTVFHTLSVQGVPLVPTERAWRTLGQHDADYSSVVINCQTQSKQILASSVMFLIYRVKTMLFSGHSFQTMLVLSGSH